MSERLNKRRIDPAKWARAGQCLKGMVDLAVLPRLTALLTCSDGVATVNLQFGVDRDGQPGILGVVTATLQTTCQRCLEKMQLDVGAAVSLGIVSSPEQAQQLSMAYEPLIVGEDPVSIAALVEDELILALPIVAVHPPAECGVGDRVVARGVVEPVPDETTDRRGRKGKKNPFEVLKKLREGR